eukprot:4146743-Prymnesium_polylepis.1
MAPARRGHPASVSTGNRLTQGARPRGLVLRVVRTQFDSHNIGAALAAFRPVPVGHRAQHR